VQATAKEHHTRASYLVPLAMCLLFWGGCGGGSAPVAPPTTPADASVQSPQAFGYSSTITTTLQAQSASAIGETYFGMHIHNLADPNLPQNQLTPFPPFGFSVFRLWDVTTWNSIEAAQGTFNWAKLDGTIQTAGAHGVSDFVFTFGYVPQWASSNPSGPCGAAPAGSCFAPTNIADFDDFATRMVQRYCGVIKYYETWNEPSAQAFWAGTNAQLLTLTQHLYRITKDPANCGCANNVCSPGGGTNSNQVLLPPINTPTQGSAQQWLQEWLAFVGSPYPYADVAAFHGYGYTDDPEDIYQGVQDMANTLAQYGLGGVEMWNTEASWGQDLNQTQDGDASWLMRYHIVQAITGVSRFIWYAYDNCDWGTLWGPSCGMPQDSWTGIRPAGTAYGVVQQWLTGATVEYCEAHADGTWACKLTRPNGYVAWAVWSSNGNSITTPVPSGWGLVQYRDWQNEKLPLESEMIIGPMPILLENMDGF
jgi:hypothetical protein